MKNLLLTLLPLLCLTFSGIGIISLFFSEHYFFDLFSTLTPYWFILSLFIIFALFAFSLKNPYLVSTFGISFSLLVLSITSFCMAFQVLSFTTNLFTPPQVFASQKFEKTVIVATFNKLFSNTNYAEIDKKINELNPDILVITEIKRSDKEKIKSLEQYQYFLMKDARDGATISIFSKFPLHENTEFNSPFVLSLKATINNKEFYIFALHPLPPATNQWTKDRNDEISNLVSYINTLDKNKVILLGDFNLSPWSKAYKKITSQMPEMKNTAQGTGIHFTWHGSIIQTQIDHIFVGNTVNITGFGSKKVNGSDHNLIWAKVQL